MLIGEAQYNSCQAPNACYKASRFDLLLANKTIKFTYQVLTGMKPQ